MNNDSSSTLKSKTCIDCKRDKPVSEFYFRLGETGSKYYDSRCKKCKSIYSNQLQRNRGSETIPSVDLAIARMAEYGIYAVAGKYSAFTYVDVVAFGCVLIEVKYSILKDGAYQFRFNSRQISEGFKSDLIVLMTDSGAGIGYSVMPCNMDVFFHKDGYMKQGIYYKPVAENRKSKRYLSNELMDNYEDAWQQVFDLVSTWQHRLSNQELRVWNNHKKTNW